MKRQKAMGGILCALLALSFLTACSTENPPLLTDRVHIEVVGNAPEEAYISRQELFLKETGATFEYVPWSDDGEFFNAKLLAGELPTIYPVPGERIQSLIRNGCCRDITQQLKARGWDTQMMPVLKEAVTGEDGRIYGIPCAAEPVGILCNVDVFRAAGLTDENDMPQYPTSWDEMLEVCKTIKEKTGIQGLAISASDYTSGMYWANIAWNYGADLCAVDEVGNAVSQLNSPEAVTAMELIQKMVQSGYVFGDPCLDTAGAAYRAVDAGTAAMAFGKIGTVAELTMDPENLALVPVPAGNTEKITLVTGSYWLFAPDATDEEVDKALEYIELFSESPVQNATRTNVVIQEAAERVKNGMIYLPHIPCYTGTETADYLALTETYIVLQPERYTAFYEVCGKWSGLCGEEAGDNLMMYHELAAVLQEIFVNPEADVQELMNVADENYQIHLDMAALE